MSTPEPVRDGTAPTPALRLVRTTAPEPEVGRTADGRTFGEVLRSRVAQQVAPLRAVPTTVETPQAADQAGQLKWSAHATARMRQRGIELGPEQQQRLQAAVDKAAAKGSRDSLVLLDGTAMVVSVANRTVITALGTEGARDNVFTGIDSAVVA